MDESLVEDAHRVKVRYEYKFDDGSGVEFQVDADLMSSVQEEYSDHRYEWAELEFQKCDHCPLSSTEHKYCPAALSLTDIVEYFGTHPHHQQARCTVHVPGRTIRVTKGIQEAVAALIGLRLASSKCPILSQLKPMARFHEPFSYPYYTVYRATSMYLLGQFFNKRKGETPDWDLDKLTELYDAIGLVNMNISERLKAAKQLQNSPVSLMIFSVYSLSMTLLFEEHIEVLQGLFES